MLYEVKRLLINAQTANELPKYLILENVKPLVGKRFRADFDRWLQYLDEIGYNTYWQVLDAKDFGIPQHRERVYAVSIRKDIDTGFEFPEPMPLTTSLADFLDAVVDDKYYISDAFLEFAKRKTEKSQQRGHGFKFKPKSVSDTANTLTTGEGHRIESTYIKPHYAILNGGQWDKLHDINRRCYSADGYAPTITTCGGGNTEPKAFYSDKIRKLTPKECWRLMGFDDAGFEKASKVCSNTQLYKQAGNSIVVNVLEKIFEKLLEKRK